MFTARHAAAIALPALLVFGLSGCSLLQAKGSDTTLTGVAACAQGHTWTVDTADLAAQVLKDLQKQKVPATAVDAKGTQTMTWDVNGAMSVVTDYTLTVTAAPAPDQALIATQVHKGTATGKAYVDADVAIPRNWDATATTVDTTFTLNGAEVKDSVPFTTIVTDFDDSVGLELTCDGTAMTTHPRGSDVTQKWTRSN